MMQYLSAVCALLKEIDAFEQNKIFSLAEKIADATQKDGLIYIFGCGHSHIAAEECFYRAGGLANVCPVLDEKLMLHKGAVTSSRLERENGTAKDILEKYNISDNDILIVVSTSGINGVPVQMAQEGKRRGAFTAAITSRAYDKELSRADGGKHLYESSDLAIDNHCPKGDACIAVGESSCAPLSTVAAVSILNAAIAEAVKLLYGRGYTPPLLVSGNVAGGAEKNAALLKRYEKRVACLR